MKQTLIGKTLAELQALVLELGMPKFTAAQLARWLYRKGARSFDEMTDISIPHRQTLNQNCRIGLTPPLQALTSQDGTRKYLFPTATGHPVETVFIPEGQRATLCLSSQAGCKMNCLFCQTGKQGWQGNLEAADILNQIYALPEAGRLTNIVFMGQGEPLDNYEAVMRAIEILQAPYGLAWSPRRITLSTVGLRKNLRRLLDESQCHLAVSLHTPIPEQRLRLMPAERQYPIADIVSLLRQYDWTGQRRITFEYTMMGGENDTPLHARQLCRLLTGLPCRVNIIRWHKIPDVPLRETTPERMAAFRDYLNAHGITATIRASRGQDILAACGLLSTATAPTAPQPRPDITS